MKVLVTGGAGYFGHLLVKTLQASGHEVRVFDLNELDDPDTTVEMVVGDIRDFGAVAKASEGVDVVFHNVAQVPLAKDKDLFESVNRHGTENMLRAALEAKAKKVIYTSSSAVFGVPDSNPVTEKTVPTPMEAYGQAKFEGERACHSFVERGLDVSIIRPRTIMGHGRLGIFQILFEWIREGYNVPVLGRGDNEYQFVHADDLADACVLAAGRAGPATYNCGSKEFGTMRQTLEALCAHAKTGSKVTSVPMWPAVVGMNLTSKLGLSPLGAYHSLMYGRSMYFDITKAESELGWQPRYSNVEMFVDSYEWYLANRLSMNEGESAATMSHHRRGVDQGILGLVKHVL